LAEIQQIPGDEGNTTHQRGLGTQIDETTYESKREHNTPNAKSKDRREKARVTSAKRKKAG
jgi:hypothetical protein